MASVLPALPRLDKAPWLLAQTQSAAEHADLSAQVSQLLARNEQLHAERIKSLEGDVMTLKRESSEGTAQHRALKTQIKEVGDGLAAHKKEVRRASDQTEMRYEAYDEACAAFAQALKIANPVAAALSSAAAAL